MFSKQIVETDAFLDMPKSSQLLYFHLNMEADDDGFVSSPKKIMRVIGASEDDIKILLAKRFLLTFESGVVVIKHWLIHNYIRKDTYQETKYLKEKNSLKIKENGGYTERQRLVDDSSTQDRLGKDRIGQDSIDKDNKLTINKIFLGEFKNVELTEDEYKKLLEKIGENNAHILIEELSGYLKSTGKNKYKNHYATLLNWARRKIETRQLQIKKRTII